MVFRSWATVLVRALTAVWLLAGVAFADIQQLNLRRIDSTPDGDFKFSAIIKVVQDDLGFIWLGTENGLYRYDGRQTVAFLHDENDSSGLEDNYINGLATQGHFLWIATRKGLQKLDLRTFRFSHFSSENSNLTDSTIYDVLAARDGTLYAATRKGLSIIQSEPENFLYNGSNSPKGLSGESVKVLFEDSQGKLWLGMEHSGLSRFEPSTKTFQHYQHDPLEPSSLIHNQIRSITEDKQGRIWVGTWGGGISILDSQGKHFQHLTVENSRLPGSYILDLEASMGGIWVASEKGGLAFVDDSLGMKRFKHNPVDRKTLLYNTVKDIFTDTDGNLWFATFPNGLNYFNKATSQFYNWQYQYGDAESLNHSAVLSLHQSRDGMIWVGTEEGFNRIDPTNNKVQPAPAGISFDKPVTSIAEDEKGQIWLGRW